MNTITSFDKKNAQAIHEEMLVLLAPLGAKYGLKIRQAGGTIGTDTLTLKVEFRAEGEDAEKAAFAKNCALFRCEPEDYGRVGLINNRKVKLVGFELKRSKFCVRGYLIEEKKVMLYTEEALWKNWKIERARPKTDAEILIENDRAAKADGFTHRLNAWIHPEAGGSDYPKQRYFKGEPSKADIAEFLAMSCVKDDYKVTVL